MPAPAVPAADAAMVNGVDPEKAKQLTQAVAEQVRSLAGNTVFVCRLNCYILSHLIKNMLLEQFHKFVFILKNLVALYFIKIVITVHKSGGHLP